MRLWQKLLLTGAMVVPIAVTPVNLRADDRVYHDRARNDDHRWDAREDRAYRAWVRENHMKYREFRRLRQEDQERYWGWRHEHPDGR